MELGISMFGDLRLDAQGKPQNPQQRLSEIIEEIKLMDALGLDFFGIGEHHRPDYAVSSPEILLAASAAVTKNIKLGSAVTVLSSTDPVKVYQNFAMIDLLSAGRAEITAGRGSFIESFPLFGYDLRDYDALFDEKLNLLLKINQNRSVTWEGKFRPPLKDQLVLPRAMNDQIPIWIAVGGTPESVVRAGKLGLPLVVAIIGGGPEQFIPLFDLYKDTYQKHGHDMSKYQVGIHVHTFLGEKSTGVADKYFPIYSAQMNRIGKSRGWPPYQRNQFDFGLGKRGALFVGGPQEVIDKILMAQEMFGLTRFSAHMDMGAPEHSEMMKSIEVYGTKVAPKVLEALKN